MQMVIEPSNVSRAYLMPDPDNEPNTYWNCRLAPLSRPLEGKTLIEAKDFLKAAARTRLKAREEMAESRALQNKQLGEIRQTSAQAKPADDRSKAQKVARIGENRHNERIFQQASNPNTWSAPFSGYYLHPKKRGLTMYWKLVNEL